MSEIVDQVSFNLGIPANSNVEDLPIEKAVLIAFRELKAYMKTPTNKTVPYSTRIDLLEQGIRTVKVLYVYPAYPKVGIALSNVDSGNVFALAASVNNGALSVNSTYDMDPIVRQLAMAQVSNTLSQDFQWTYDLDNQVVYCTCKQARPNGVTIRYVPDYQDVSEIKSQVWIDYLIRLSEANMKKALGRSRSKYKIEGSNVTLDGEILLQEANEEFTQIREELKGKKRKLVVVN
jgi:hypothetical protein